MAEGGGPVHRKGQQPPATAGHTATVAYELVAF